MIGCWLSHRQVLLDALDEGLELIAVIEDELTLDPNVGQVLNTAEFGLDAGSEFCNLYLDNCRVTYIRNRS